MDSLTHSLLLEAKVGVQPGHDGRSTHEGVDVQALRLRVLDATVVQRSGTGRRPPDRVRLEQRLLRARSEIVVRRGDDRLRRRDRAGLPDPSGRHVVSGTRNVSAREAAWHRHALDCIRSHGRSVQQEHGVVVELELFGVLGLGYWVLGLGERERRRGLANLYVRVGRLGDPACVCLARHVTAKHIDRIAYGPSCRDVRWRIEQGFSFVRVSEPDSARIDSIL